MYSTTSELLLSLTHVEHVWCFVGCMHVQTSRYIWTRVYTSGDDPARHREAPVTSCLPSNLINVRVEGRQHITGHCTLCLEPEEGLSVLLDPFKKTDGL